MSDAMDHLSDEQATLLWRRAAELQAEAARRLEERSRQLAPSERDGGAGFQLTEVKAAALEAGISPEFVELALAEVEARGSQRTPSESIERRARKFLGVPRTSIEVSRVIDAPPAEVFESLQRVLPSSRFALLHVNTLGDDPLKDGVFVFEPPSMWTQAGTAADFASKMGGVGVKRLYVSLREITAERSELSIRVPIAKGLRTNYLLGLGSVGIVGGGAGLIGAFMAAGAVGGIGIAAAPVVAVAMLGGGILGGGSLGGLTTWGIGAAFRHSVRKAEDALNTLLQVIDVGTRSKGAFAVPGPGDASPPSGALPAPGS